MVKIALTEILSRLEKMGINKNTFLNKGGKVTIDSVHLKPFDDDGLALSDKKKIFLMSLNYLTDSAGHWTQDKINAVLAHEIGHLVASEYFSGDVREYFIMRNIPFTRSCDAPEWGDRPSEIFANDFSQVIFPELAKSQLTPTNLKFMDEATLRKVKEYIIGTIKSEG